MEELQTKGSLCLRAFQAPRFCNDWPRKSALRDDKQLRCQEE